MFTDTKLPHQILAAEAAAYDAESASNQCAAPLDMLPEEADQLAAAYAPLLQALCPFSQLTARDINFTIR